MGYYGNEFKQLYFPKAGHEIREKGHDKIQVLKGKLEDRERALREQIKDAGLNDSVDILLNIDDLLNENNSSANAPSDVKVRLQNLVRKVRDEKDELERVELMVRNLPSDETFNLSFDALIYFGF